MRGASRRALSALTALVAVASLAVQPLSADEPSVDVAHVSFVQGGVSVRSAAATINIPLFDGDALATAPNGRAEVQLDGVSIVRAGRSTEVRFTSLAPAHRVVRVERGTIELRFFRGLPQTTVETPSVSVMPDEPGVYRIGVDADGKAKVDVRSGRAQLPMPGGGSLTLLPGRLLVASGDASSPAIAYAPSPALDELDRWGDARDRELGRAVASSTLSPALAAEALAAYGSWLQYPGYGSVWAPNVEEGWAPYTLGGWLWTPFGQTWVSSEPWGWAPYHYGSWFFDGTYGWLWAPGAVAVWAPAPKPNAPYAPWWGWRARPGAPIVTNPATNYPALKRVFGPTHPSVSNGTATLRFPLQAQIHAQPPAIAPPAVHPPPPRPAPPPSLPVRR